MLALCLLGAVPARAELRLASAGSTPATIAFPNPVRVVYSLQVSAVGRDEVFSLRVAAPFFGRDATATSPIGASLEFVHGGLSIAGPAQLLGPAAGGVGEIVCPSPGGVHGFATHSSQWDMRVPAGTTSTLSFEFQPAGASPWPSTSYDVPFTALRRLVSGAPGTLAADQGATVAGPSPIGTRGVQLSLTSTPRTLLSGLKRIARVTQGRRIAIRGTMRPALAGRRIGLWVRTLAKPWWRLVQTAVTDRRGRFRGNVTAQRGLQVMARIGARAPYVADYSCALGFDVRRR